MRHSLCIEEILDEILENDPAQSEGDEPVSKSWFIFLLSTTSLFFFVRAN